MNLLNRRIAALEQTHSRTVTAESPTAEIAKFLASVPLARLMTELADFSEKARAEVVEEIRAHVPGYGVNHAEH